MITQKKFFRIAVALFLLLPPCCCAAAEQKAEPKTKYKKVIPWVQVPEKYPTFEEFSQGKKPPEIKAQFWKALGAKKPEEQRFADVKKIAAELHITKDGKRVTAATLAEAQKIVWDNYCFERMMSQRLRYLCCFWPFEDAKQAFFIEFQNKYSTCTPEVRAKIDADWAGFFIKQAAKENLTFADWELREAMMQHLCCRIVLKQVESAKPGKLTDAALAKMIKERAGEITLEYAEKTVSLADVFTDWEITDTIIRFKNTMLINCVVDNVSATEITKLGFEMTTSQAEHLGALRLNASQVSGHVAEMQRILDKVGRIDRSIRTSLVLGDKPILLMLGEAHYRSMSSCLEICFMKVVMENSPLVYFPEYDGNNINVMERVQKNVPMRLFSGIGMNIYFCRALKLDVMPVDLYSGGPPGQSFKAESHARSVVMVEKMCDYLSSPHGKVERVAVGIFGGAHLGHFRESQMESPLKSISVPISVSATYDFDAKTVFNELRAWDILRRLYPDKVKEFAETFYPDKTHHLTRKIRACNNVDVFAGKSMHSIPGNATEYGGLSTEQRNHTIAVREKMLAAWEETFDAEVSSEKKSTHDKNIEVYTEHIRQRPDNAWGYLNRSDAYLGKGEYDKAIDDCTEAIRLDPKFDRPYLNRGDAYRKKGELDKAIADYTVVIRLNPERAPAYQGRGQAYEKKGEVAKAKADFDQAKKLGYKP